MRKIILNVNTSLDGVATDLERWMDMTGEIIADSSRRYDEIDAAIFGSGTYPGMAAYWATAETKANSEIERELARKLNAKKKLILSRRDVDTSLWSNTEHLRFEDASSLAQVVSRLKSGPGKAIAVESGIGAWKLFLQNQLFDELIITVHPVVAGRGERFFPESEKMWDPLESTCRHASLSIL